MPGSRRSTSPPLLRDFWRLSSISRTMEAWRSFSRSIPTGAEMVLSRVTRCNSPRKRSKMATGARAISRSSSIMPAPSSATRDPLSRLRCHRFPLDLAQRRKVRTERGCSVYRRRGSGASAEAADCAGHRVLRLRLDRALHLWEEALWEEAVDTAPGPGVWSGGISHVSLAAQPPQEPPTTEIGGRAASIRGGNPRKESGMRKAVFVDPSSTHLHVYSRFTIPRLGSVLLGTIMRDRGWDVKVYIEDIAPVGMGAVLSADIVGISGITSTAPPCYRLAATVRAAGIPVVLGGTHTTFLPDEGLDHADYVVRGEGEFAFPELVEAIEGGGGFDRIQGLSYWRDGQKVHNPERPKLANLDVNPIPDFSLVVGYGRPRIASVATSRGCPFPCAFCSVPGMYGSAFRTHSIDRVIAELKTHAGTPYIFFADDIFTANRKRTKDLLSRMIAEGVTPKWGAQVRTETVDDDELLKLMRQSNCFNVFVGFESINPKTLHLFKKKQDLAKIRRSITRFHDHGINIHGMFVVGSDEDDVETIYQTAQFARDNQIETIQLMILTPIPGSPDWTTLYAQGKKDILTDNWELYDGHHCVHQPRKISPYELQLAAMKGTEQFYSWGAILESLFN